MIVRFRNLFRRYHIDSRILIGFLLLTMFAFVFLKAASELIEGNTLAFDIGLLQRLRDPSDAGVPIGPGWLQVAMLDVTALGGVTVLTLLTALSAGYLLAHRKFETAAFVVAAISGGAIASMLLKTLFARPRPDIVVHLVEVHNASFPSGHAMNSAITYLTLGALLARSERNRAVRAYLLVVAIVMTLLIGLTRIYLGVHWPSDVIAGWWVGACWAAFCSLFAKVLQRRHHLEAPTSDES